MYINTYKDKNIKNLMLSLVKNKRKVMDKQVGSDLEDILLIIANNPCSSVDTCCKFINQDHKQKKDMNIEHETVYTRIRKLEGMELIK